MKFEQLKLDGRITMRKLVARMVEMDCKYEDVFRIMKSMPKPVRKIFESRYVEIRQRLSEGRRRRNLRQWRGLLRCNSVDARQALSALAFLAQYLDPRYSMGYSATIAVSARTGRSLHRYHSNCREYSKSCQWRATHGSVFVNLSVSDARNMRIIGGVPSVVGDAVDGFPKVRHCKWIATKGRKHNFKWYWKTGYITSDYHADTVQSAMEWRALRAMDIAARRASKEDIKRRAERVFVGFDHSIKAGNCREGTLEFCRRHNLNPDLGYRLDWVISLDERDSFAKRLLKFAYASKSGS